MSVGADIAGHDKLAARVDLLILRIAAQQVAGRADGANSVVFDVDSVIVEDATIIPGDEGRMGYQHELILPEVY